MKWETIENIEIYVEKNRQPRGKVKRKNQLIELKIIIDIKLREKTKH